MKHIHTKKITIELFYTDKEFDYLIDTVIKLNDKYHSSYHLKNTKKYFLNDFFYEKNSNSQQYICNYYIDPS
jgi:hypothetical protein